MDEIQNDIEENKFPGTFPLEIIRVILYHVDDDTLKRCLLASEEIRELIIKTPQLMRRLDVILFHDTWQQKLPFLEKYGYFVRSLRFDDIGFNSIKQIKDVLRKTPNVEKLRIEDCYVITERNENNDDGDQENDPHEEQIPGVLENENNPINIVEDGAVGDNEEVHQVDDPSNDNPANPNPNEEQHLDAVQVNENLGAIIPNEENNQNQAIANNNILENNDNQVPENMNHEVDDELNNVMNEIVPIIHDAIDEIVDNNNNNNNNNENEQNEAEVQAENQTDENKNANDKEDNEPLDLKKLQHLFMESSSLAGPIVTSIPECNTLKSLKITFYYQDPVAIFTDFLCRQKNLETLEIASWSDMVFKCLFQNDIRDQIGFRLKKFTLECEMSYHANFSKFFKSQADYIQELELTSYNINFHYYRIIFNHFHRLRKLNMPIDWFMTDSRISAINECRIPSLKELELVGTNDDIATFKTVVNIFPNLEILKCENLQNFSLYGILENFQNLHTLRTENFRCEVMLFVKLPSLKILETSYLYPMALKYFWQKLAEDSPNIEQLTIEDIGHFKILSSIRTEYNAILRSLKYFKQLRKCTIVCNPSENTVNPDEDAGDHGIEENLDHAFYKVVINLDENSIKITDYFAEHCIEEVNVLKETFKECDISNL